MNKFNLPLRNVQKERRAKRAERRRLKSSAAPSKAVSCASLSGKNKRKLEKKWRLAQKEALQSGLVTMQDIEMMAADEEGGVDQGSSQPKAPKSGRVVLTKKRALKLRLKSSSSKGKGKQVSEPVATSNAGAEDEDSMMQ